MNNNESPHTYLVPQNWVTIDVLQSTLNDLFGDPTYVVNSVSQIGSAHGGVYALRMSVAVSNAGDTIAGAIFSEPSAVHFFDVAFGGQGALGFPYTTRSGTLTGFRKFTITGGDSATIGVIMTKWNTSTNTRDTLVNVQDYLFSTPAAAWTSFSIPLTYSSSANPDTCLIFAGIVAQFPHVGTVFQIDDLAFSGIAGVDEEHNTASVVSLMPNPFSDETTLSFSDVNLNHATLEVYDVLGNKVRVLTELNGSNIKFNREGLNDGLYFYSVIDENGVVVSGKMIIQ